MEFKRKQRAVVPPDITPLIDVVFLLLIFFMLSTTFIINPGININLPKSSAEEIKMEKQKVIVTISKDGEIYVEDKKIDMNILRVILNDMVKTSKESTVIISADEDTSHGIVVSVMDMAKLSGVTRLAIETEPK
ncbi:MAG: biopolymer transporter ExbD [Deltaproteobacteria bacterium]|nr:biopolymer transporter ExbD [Deltaproteobacteria bacterium]